PLHLVGGGRARTGPDVRGERGEEPLGREGSSGRRHAVGHDSRSAVYARLPGSLKGAGGGVTVNAQASFATDAQAPSIMAKPDDDSASEPRRGCLDEQEIVDFVSGLLPAAKLPGFEAHLSSCDKCTELVAAAAPLVASSMEVTRSLPTQGGF